MKVQQIAVYESLKAFMLAIGYAQASEQRQDDPVWSTLNEQNFKAMMEYKFGVEPRHICAPSTLEQVHQGIRDHEAWVYLEALEFEEGEEAPAVVVAQAVTTEAPAPAPAPAPAEPEAPAPTPAPTAPPAPVAPPPTEAPAPAPAAPEVVEEITKEFEEQQPASEDKALGDSQPGEGVPSDAGAEQQPQQEPPAQEGSSEQE